MAFRTRPIRKRPPMHPLRKLHQACEWIGERKKTVKSHERGFLAGVILVVVATLIVWKVMTGLYSWVQKIDFGDLFFAVGTELKQDEHGYTNLVFLGDGGAIRDGAELVDTIMVASIDNANRTVTLLSIPRDYYVNSQYNSRINELYRNHKNLLGTERAWELFQEVTGKITGLDIHYYLRGDFTAFVESVDELGGIDINVPETIDDPYYPNATDDGYEPFKIEAGIQHLDGETALKYVRSRKTTSDYDRAVRQHLILEAIREKALSADVLTRPNVLKKLYGTLKKHINTNLSVTEILSLARFAKNFDQERLISRIIHDDPGQEGGFLYTPEREQYNGQFVLVPDGDNLTMIHQYADLIFNKRQMFYEPVNLEMLNATKVSGLAGKTAFHLNRFGFDVKNVDNLLNSSGERSYAEKSVMRYYDWSTDEAGNVIPKYPVFLEALKEFIKADAVPADPTLKLQADITVVLGSDYINQINP